LKDNAINWMRRHGRYLPNSRRSIWLHSDEIADFSAAEALITFIRRRWPAYRIVHTANDRMTVRWISTRFRDDAVLPLPDHVSAMKRFIKALSPQSLILLNNATIRPDLYQVVRQHVPAIIADDVDHDGLFTCLAAERHPEPHVVRKELGIGPDVNVLAVSYPTPDEIMWWGRVFQDLKKQFPGMVLLIETPFTSQCARTFSPHNLRVSQRSQPSSSGQFDVCIMDIPAEFPGMSSVASAVVLGGTISGKKAIASPIWFAAMKIPILTGSKIQDQNHVARRFMEAGGFITFNSSDSLTQTLRGILSGELDTHEVIGKAHGLVLDAEFTATRQLERITPLIPVPPPENAHQQGWRIKTRLDRFADTKAGSMIARMRSAHRINQWDQLRERLHQPNHILCLGNGPSSEDSALSSLPHDALFRVNWRWKQRTMLTHPDVVFVGDPKTVHHLSGPIMAFGSVDWEQTMLLRHLLAGHAVSPAFFTMERMPGKFSQNNWWARPSNGAIMIAAAATLAPERITIAGIDLFQHPDGRYPGDVRSTNDYAQVHHRNVDLDVIRSALRDFRGEVHVMGDILNQALKENR